MSRWPTNPWCRMKFTMGDGCWEWYGTLTGDGYGKLWYEGRRRNAHALVYELLVGPVPEGLELDHLCRNRKCVRPDHLEPVTHKENCNRGDVNQCKGITHCKRGHEFTEENTTLNKYGGRVCRTCGRDRSRDFQRKKRASNV